MHGLIRDIHDQRQRRNFENFNFLRGFLICFVHYGYAKCEIMYHRLVLYLNMYYHLPFSCGTLLKSKNWFDVLNFRFSQLHDYSGYTIIRDSRVTRSPPFQELLRLLLPQIGFNDDRDESVRKSSDTFIFRTISAFSTIKT